MDKDEEIARAARKYMRDVLGVNLPPDLDMERYRAHKKSIKMYVDMYRNWEDPTEIASVLSATVFALTERDPATMLFSIEMLKEAVMSLIAGAGMEQRPIKEILDELFTES